MRGKGPALATPDASCAVVRQEMRGVQSGEKRRDKKALGGGGDEQAGGAGNTR